MGCLKTWNGPTRCLTVPTAKKATKDLDNQKRKCTSAPEVLLFDSPNHRFNPKCKITVCWKFLRFRFFGKIHVEKAPMNVANSHYSDSFGFPMRKTWFYLAFFLENVLKFQYARGWGDYFEGRCNPPEHSFWRSGVEQTLENLEIPRARKLWYSISLSEYYLRAISHDTRMRCPNKQHLEWSEIRWDFS